VSEPRLYVWRGLEEWLAEAAVISVDSDSLSARGTQLGAEPEPYRVDYELTTGGGFVSQRLWLAARSAGSERRLELVRGSDGGWSANGAALPEVEGALDCDLANCPVTNTMPLLRERLRDGGEPKEFVMAWVSVPDLGVHRSAQRYEPIDAHTVRYVSLDSDFRAELELDDDGLVVRYPRMAERLSSGAA
jgi:uncharacterized protein